MYCELLCVQANLPFLFAAASAKTGHMGGSQLPRMKERTDKTETETVLESHSESKTLSPFEGRGRTGFALERSRWELSQIRRH